MAYLVGVPLLILVAVFQSAALAHVRVLGGTVDLVLLITLSWTLAGDWRGGMVLAFIGGLCLDLLSGGPMGAATVSLLVVSYLASLTEVRFWRSHVLLPLATIMLGSVIFHGSALLMLAVNGYALNLPAALWRITLPSLVLNTLCMLPVYRMMRWLYGVVYPPPVELDHEL